MSVSTSSKSSVKRGSIVVLTHNGKLPKDGGKRWGYQCGNMVFPLGGVPYRLVPKQKPKPLIAYMELPKVRYFDGECRECGHYPNPTEIVETTSGPKKVFVCKKCSCMMRGIH